MMVRVGEEEKLPNKRNMTKKNVFFVNEEIL